jgi:hypothetical protein
MMPVQALNFEDATLVGSATGGTGISREVSGGLIRRLLMVLGGTATNAAAVSVNRAGATNLLGDIRLTQDGSVFFNALAADLRFGFDLMLGGNSDQIDSDVQPGAQNIGDTLDMNFGRIFPGAAIDASGQHRAGFRIDSLPPAQYSETSTAYNLLLRAIAEHEGGQNVAPYMLPRFSYEAKPVESASPAILVEKSFEHPGFLLGVSIRCRDSGANLRNQHVDGLVKRLKVKHIRAAGGTTEVFDGTWKMLRKITQQRFRVPTGKRNSLGVIDHGLEPGFVFFPFFNPKGPAGAAPIASNDRLQFFLDTSSTVETPFTNVVPAAGDQAILTYWYFTPVGAGSADRAQRGVVQSAGSNARVARAATRGRGGRRLLGRR